ncbi:SDR family oxidoreductase, partial [Mesorhizobium sp. M2D.F.Ca.ET.145.01.1.1]
ITLSMARELGHRHIRVNSIAPGGVDTEGLQRIGIVGSEHEKALVAVTPLGRFGQSEDIAKVAVFLASDEAGWVSGERITAAGGWR